MKDFLLNYIKSFKIFFPTWIICIFFLLLDNFICALIGIILLILQAIQIHFCKKKYVLLSDFENEKLQIIEDAEAEKRSLIEQIKELEQVAKSIDEKVLKAKEETKSEDADYIGELKQQISMLNEKLEINRRRGEFVGYSGHYRVGIDIDSGSYLVVPCGGKDAYIELFSSYTKFKREEDAIISTSTSTEYRIALPENGAYLVVENGDIYHSPPIKRTDGRSDFLGYYDIPILEED